MSKTLLILTDTTSEQINGVTRTIENLKKHLPENIILQTISADDFFSVPFFGYKEIRLSLSPPGNIYKRILEIRPDFIHIATEGPIGFAGAITCKKYNIPYTTSFHTKFPEYLHLRNSLVKEKYVHEYLHYIHDGAEKIFISHEGMISYLQVNNYKKYTIVPLGIDHSVFFPGEKNLFQDDQRIKLLFVGRLAVEKNIEAFLQISDNYSKIVVGDGPERVALEQKFSGAQFLGIQKGKSLADIYRSVDIFVFPSLTDTLGLVNLEALACGKPVIAYNTDNIHGIIHHEYNGILLPIGTPLEEGINRAKKILPEHCIHIAKKFYWENYQKLFLFHQVQIPHSLWI